MGSGPFGNVFGHDNFPPHADSANEDTKQDELYPERIQDMVNDIYEHNKVLPKQAGTDYVQDPLFKNEGAETKSTFPHNYN